MMNFTDSDQHFAVTYEYYAGQNHRKQIHMTKYFVLLFQMMSSWSVVLVSIERFVAVWIPTKAKSMNTKRNMLIYEAVLFIFFSIYDGYWTSFADIIINGYDTMNCCYFLFLLFFEHHRSFFGVDELSIKKSASTIV